MAIPKYIKLSNGAKLIYLKQNDSDTTNMNIAFACGAKCDGDYPGISHFLEHMLFEGTKKFSKQMRDKISNHALLQNAFTSEAGITTEFECINAELLNTIKYNVKLLTNKKFNLKQMANEIKIIKQEMDMYEDANKESALKMLLNAIEVDRNVDIIGNISSLKKVTPQMLVEYMEKYFVTENLIISVVTNKKLRDIKNIIENEIISKFPSKPENEVNPQIETQYQPINPMVYLPDADKKTIALAIMLRKDYPCITEDDEAVNNILDVILNGVGVSGRLFKKFRIEENQARAYTSNYAYLNHANLGLDYFSVRTAPKSVKKATYGILEIIKDLRDNGVLEADFKCAVKALTSEYDAQKVKIETNTAGELLLDYVYGVNPIDENLVVEKIRNISYEDFNNAIKEKFDNQNIMATVEGGFDTRNCLTLAEMRKKLGYFVEKEELNAFNVPKVEYEPMKDDDNTVLLELGI